MRDFAGVPVSGADDVPNDYMRVLIHGKQGSGKTTLASTVAELGPTLFIDLIGEHGTRSFLGTSYARNITVIRPESVTALNDIYDALARGDHGFKAVVIDSLTAVQKMALRFAMGYSETAVKEISMDRTPASFSVWGQAGDIMIDLGTFWYGLAQADRPHPMHVVMTAQTKVKEDEEGVSSHTPDVQPAALSILLASPDYVLYTDQIDNPDFVDGDGDADPLQYVVRFGGDPEYRTKARVPVHLRGRVPRLLGRKRPLSLATLARTLGVGGIPQRPAAAGAAPTKTTAAKAAAAAPERSSNG